jgi:cob(I)alamin adenosyltransferase
LGLARSLCKDARTKETLKQVQRELFTVGAEMSTIPEQVRESNLKHPSLKTCRTLWNGCNLKLKRENNDEYFFYRISSMEMENSG